MCQGFLAATCRSLAQKRDSTLMLWNSATFSGNFDSMWASALLLLQYASFRVKLFSFSVNSQVVWRLHVFINWKLIYWLSCIFLRNIYIHTLIRNCKERTSKFRKLISKTCFYFRYLEILAIDLYFTLWKVSKYGVFSGPYFPVFGAEKARYLDSFHAVRYLDVLPSYFYPP